MSAGAPLRAPAAALAAGLIALASCAAAAAADPLSGWSISGSNTARFEYYDDDGERSASPYPFRHGQAFDELGLDLLREPSPYDRWRGQVYGVVNASDYRSDHHGLVPERISLVHEKGDSGLPYRLEIGDFYSYLSALTVQQTLRGAQVDLQPRSGAGGRRSSVVLFTGTGEPDWVGMQPADDYSSGASWLIADPRAGTLSLNFVHNYRDSVPGAGLPSRSQYVMSIAGERRFRLAAQRLTFDAELAHFSGDHDGTAGGASGQDQSGNGYFLELAGADAAHPLDYRLRYERYGRDFRPRGAVVTPDHRAAELHAGWRFAGGLRLRGRLQSFVDGASSADPLDTRTYGVMLTGPLLGGRVRGLSGRLDAFHQHQDNTSESVDRDVGTLTLDLSKPLAAGWFGRLGLFLQTLADHSASAASLRTRQVSFAADHRIRVAGFEGRVSPGILLRRLRAGGADSDEWRPTLALHLARGPHALDFSFNDLVQDRRLTGGVDVETRTVGLDYRYSRGRSTFGLEANLFTRAVDPGRDTDAYRVGLFWTYRFERSAQPPRGAAPLAVAAQGPVSADLWGLAPGTPLERARAALREGGISGGVERDGMLVYEHAMLAEIEQRQRLVLEHEGGAVTVSALIIDFDDVGNRESLAQTFERVRRALIERHGRPDSTYQVGEFSDDLAAEVNAQRFIRVIEWRALRGVIRFGIPRRLDGRVRMEIQYRRDFGPPRDTLWSIDTLP